MMYEVYSKLPKLFLVELVDEPGTANFFDRAPVPEFFLAELFGTGIVEAGHVEMKERLT